MSSGIENGVQGQLLRLAVDIWTTERKLTPKPDASDTRSFIWRPFTGIFPIGIALEPLQLTTAEPPRPRVEFVVFEMDTGEGEEQLKVVNKPITEGGGLDDDPYARLVLGTLREAFDGHPHTLCMSAFQAYQDRLPKAPEGTPLSWRGKA